MSTSTEPPKITAYLKTFCGWSEGVRAIMRKYDLEFEEKDIIKNPAFRWEMEQKSGQPLSPCVEVNGTMLADVSGEEVEAWMLANNIVSPNDRTPDAPINQRRNSSAVAGRISELVETLQTKPKLIELFMLLPSFFSRRRPCRR